MRRIRLIHTSPIEAFASAVYAQGSKVYRVWIISPWITTKERDSHDALQLFITALRHNPRCRLTVLTREPKEAGHLQSLQLLRHTLKPIIYYCSSLHTKLYIVESQRFRLAIVGSANLTVAGNRLNLELALELRTTSESRDDDVAAAISDLGEYARKLLLEDDVTLSS